MNILLLFPYTMFSSVIDDGDDDGDDDDICLYIHFLLYNPDTNNISICLQHIILPLISLASHG
jgi:hypothetical protein